MPEASGTGGLCALKTRLRFRRSSPTIAQREDGMYENAALESDTTIDAIQTGNWADLLDHLRAEQRLTEAADVNPPAIRVHPLGEDERARRVTRRSNFRTTGKLPIAPLGRMVQWESRIERDAWVLLTTCPLVVFRGEQPRKLEVKIDGEWKAHYPDALVLLEGFETFAEIKQDQEALKPEVVARTNAVRAGLASKGYGYCVLTESLIREEPRLANCWQVHWRGLASVDPRSCEALRRSFQRNGGVLTLKEVMATEDGERALAEIVTMVREGRIVFDMTQPWGPETRFYSML